MKSFKTFVIENYNAPTVSINRNFVDLDELDALNELNKNLQIAMSVGFSEIGEALHKAKKVLSMYGVELERVNFRDEKEGILNIPIKTHNTSGESHQDVIKPFGSFDEDHIFKFEFKSVDGIYKISAGVVKK